jgi:hypothetical protein
MRVAVISLSLTLTFCALLSDIGQAANTTVSRSEARTWRADLAYLAEQLPKRHANAFHSVTRQQFEQAVARLHRRIPSLSRDHIVVEFMRLLAMIGDGHTTFADLSAVGWRILPVWFYVFVDGLFIQAATQEHADLAGARVIKIGELSAEQAMHMTNPLVPGENEMFVKAWMPTVLNVAEILHALGISRDKGAISLIIEKDGRRRTVVLQPIDPRVNTKWVDAGDSTSAPKPLWLKDPENHYWFEYLSDAQTLYLQFNQTQNKPDESFADFCQRVFEFVDRHTVERFVLDIRMNTGGRGSLNRPLLLGLMAAKKISQRGKLFTIIGRRTFSAAMGLAIELEKYTNTLFVGEPTGATLNGYGEGVFLKLPHSGLAVQYSALHFQSNPTDTRRWIAPQLAAELSSEDYRANRDRAMEAILNYRPERSLRSMMLDALASGRLDGALQTYREFKSNALHKFVDTEPELRRVGYRLFEMNRPNDALEIFKLNVAEHPRSANAHDDLADAYTRSGNKTLAIKNYEQSLKLNPKNWNAMDRLKELGRK